MIFAFKREIEIQGKTFTDDVDEGYRVQSHNKQTACVDIYRFLGKENNISCPINKKQVITNLIPPVLPAVPKHYTNNGIPRSFQLKSKGRRYPYPDIDNTISNSTVPPIYTTEATIPVPVRIGFGNVILKDKCER